MTEITDFLMEDFTNKLSKLNMALRQFMQSKLREHNIDLTIEMLQVLACLWRKNGINQQEIARVTIKDKASITYLIDNLTKRGLVYREEDASDRRNRLISLTAEGAALQQQIRPFVNQLHQAARKALTDDNIYDAIVILSSMLTNLKQG